MIFIFLFYKVNVHLIIGYNNNICLQSKTVYALIHSWEDKNVRNKDTIMCVCVRHNSIFIQTCFILSFVDDFWQLWFDNREYFCCLDIIFQMQIWSRRYYQKCKNDFLYIHWSQCFTSCLDSNIPSNKKYSTVYQ